MKIKKSKAQAFLSDFTISIIIMTFIIVVYFDYIKNTPNQQDNPLNYVARDAKTISQSLVSSGYPSNWNSNNVARIGFVDSGNKINNDKFMELGKINYNKSKKLLATTSDFFLFFENESHDVQPIEGFCGVGRPDVNVTYSIKSAYYYRGPGQEEYLKSFMQNQFSADIYQEGGAQNDISDLIDNINDYGLVVVESPELSSSGFNGFKAGAEPYVSSGGLLMLGGQLLSAQGKTLTGVTFKKISGSSESDRKATIVKEDDFLTFNLRDQIRFTQAYYVENNPGATNFVDIARFNESDIEFEDILNNKIAIARWEYGSGKVLFFSDFDATYFAGDFHESLEASTKKWIGAKCLPINVSNINKNNLVRTERILLYNEDATKMVLYTWN